MKATTITAVLALAATTVHADLKRHQRRFVAPGIAFDEYNDADDVESTMTTVCATETATVTDYYPPISTTTDADVSYTSDQDAASTYPPETSSDDYGISSPTVYPTGTDTEEETYTPTSMVDTETYTQTSTSTADEDTETVTRPATETATETTYPATTGDTDGQLTTVAITTTYDGGEETATATEAATTSGTQGVPTAGAAWAREVSVVAGGVVAVAVAAAVF